MLSKQNRFGALMVSGSSAVLQMKRKADYDEPESWVPAYGKITAKTCPSIPQAKATIETVDEYSKFEFKVPFFFGLYTIITFIRYIETTQLSYAQNFQIT